MDEVRMDDVVEPELLEMDGEPGEGERIGDFEFDSEAELPENADDRFLVLLDVRETQSPERLGDDGVMDFCCLSLYGKPEGLFVDYIPGATTEGTEDEGKMAFSLDSLRGVWPALTHYVYTREWCNSNQVPGDVIHLQLDPFQRELLLQALRELKKGQQVRRNGASLYTDQVNVGRVNDATSRIQEIEALELAIELAGAPTQEETV